MLKKKHWLIIAALLFSVGIIWLMAGKETPQTPATPMGSLEFLSIENQSQLAICKVELLRDNQLLYTIDLGNYPLKSGDSTKINDVVTEQNLTTRFTTCEGNGAFTKAVTSRSITIVNGDLPRW